MNPWQFFVLASGIAGAAPVGAIQQDATPLIPGTTWHCVAHSPDDAISADIDVDVNGKSYFGNVTWNANVGDGLPIHASIFASFAKGAPEILHSNMLVITPNLSGKQVHDALLGHEFQWAISTHSDSGGQYPFWYSGNPAFVSSFVKIDRHKNTSELSLKFDPDDFFAMVRGSDQLFLVARDKKGTILLRSRFLLSALRAWPLSARKIVRQAVDLTPDYLKSCERDGDQIVV